MNLRSLITAVTLILTVVCLSSCSWTSYEVTDSPDNPVDEKVITLDLSVSVLEAADPAASSRAYSGDGDFELPVSDYEKLSTLRVVIVRENGIIEHNRMVTYNQATGLINHDNLQFEVVSGEKKTVYLFGNEKQVASDNKDFSFSRDLIKGNKFPVDAVEDLLLKTDGTSSAVINNYTPSEGRIFVPMSEFFEIDVPKPKPGGTAYQTEHLFITRSLIKFSFSVTVDTPFPSGTKLNGIKIDGLADRSYYLPRETEYDPEKYTESTNPMGGRYIASFVTPQDDKNIIDYTFPLFDPFDLSAKGERKIEQHVYFPETKDGKYEISLLFDGEEQILTDLLGKQALKLTDIPRNTHVKVNITFLTHEIIATVDLVPYIGVTLEPEFGFDWLYPPQEPEPTPAE